MYVLGAIVNGRVLTLPKILNTKTKKWFLHISFVFTQIESVQFRNKTETFCMT